MTHPQSDLVTPEVVEKIRSENQRLLRRDRLDVLTPDDQFNR